MLFDLNCEWRKSLKLWINNRVSDWFFIDIWMVLFDFVKKGIEISQNVKIMWVISDFVKKVWLNRPHIAIFVFKPHIFHKRYSRGIYLLI